MNKFFKFILNGGSAVVFTIIAVNFFVFNLSFGLGKEGIYEFTAYMSIVYLLIQGVQFNLADVNSYADAAIDFGVSFIPFLFMFYVFISIDLNDNWSFIRNVMMLTTITDVFVFGWGSLKILLYTDKNAHSGT